MGTLSSLSRKRFVSLLVPRVALPHSRPSEGDGENASSYHGIDQGGVREIGDGRVCSTVFEF